MLFSKREQKHVFLEICHCLRFLLGSSRVTTTNLEKETRPAHYESISHKERNHRKIAIELCHHMDVSRTISRLRFGS